MDSTGSVGPGAAQTPTSRTRGALALLAGVVFFAGLVMVALVARCTWDDAGAQCFEDSGGQVFLGGALVVVGAALMAWTRYGAPKRGAPS